VVIFLCHKYAHVILDMMIKSPLLPQKLVFLDVETTGLSAETNRIIEVGLVRVEDGEIVAEYQQLIDPQRPLPTFIQHHTGITTKMVKTAPVFADIVDDLQELLADSTLVAHNAGFDYSFLYHEFARHDLEFASPYFCTARLSRRLYPEHRRHNLDAVISRCNLKCPNRHRAFDDAKALWQFYQHVLNEFPAHIVASCL
jgi:DNA polymerase-3 subunit epsilon